MIILDSSLIGRKVNRTDVKVFYVPATQMAREKNIPTLANMIITGKLIMESGVVSLDGLDEALKKIVSARHIDLLEVNKNAILTGYNF